MPPSKIEVKIYNYYLQQFPKGRHTFNKMGQTIFGQFLLLPKKVDLFSPKTIASRVAYHFRFIANVSHCHCHVSRVTTT